MTPRADLIKKISVAFILAAAIALSGCGVPAGMNVAISNNGQETRIFMNCDEVARPSIERDVLFVVFDGLGSSAMRRYAEKLRDNYVSSGCKAVCIKYGDDNIKARQAAIDANDKGWVICVMSYSNSDSVLGSGGRNAFTAWTEQQGIPVVEFRGDDTWGNYGNHVESNVTGILNIRGNSLGHRGPKITRADLENNETQYWDIHAPVNHLALLGDSDYWFVEQLVCVINGDNPFDSVSFDSPAEDTDGQDDAEAEEENDADESADDAEVDEIQQEPSPPKRNNPRPRDARIIVS